METKTIRVPICSQDCFRISTRPDKPCARRRKRVYSPFQLTQSSTSRWLLKWKHTLLWTSLRPVQSKSRLKYSTNLQQLARRNKSLTKCQQLNGWTIVVALTSRLRASRISWVEVALFLSTNRALWNLNLSLNQKSLTRNPLGHQSLLSWLQMCPNYSQVWSDQPSLASHLTEKLTSIWHLLWICPLLTDQQVIFPAKALVQLVKLKLRSKNTLMDTWKTF